MIKEFDIKQGGRAPKKRANKKLVDEAMARVKGTGEISEDDYLAITKAGRENEVEPEVAKMKSENALDVPNSFFELTIPEQSMLMFYLSRDYVCPFTYKRTYMNMLHSYATSHLDEKEINKIWTIDVVRDETGSVVDYKLKIKNHDKYNRTNKDALRAFNNNPDIVKAWSELVKMKFVIQPEDLIKTAIIQDALEAENYKDRNQNRKMALDILQIGQKIDQAQMFNVFLQGGGAELAEAAKNLSDNQFITTKDDLKVDD